MCVWYSKACKRSVAMVSHMFDLAKTEDNADNCSELAVLALLPLLPSLPKGGVVFESFETLLVTEELLKWCASYSEAYWVGRRRTLGRFGR